MKKFLLVAALLAGCSPALIDKLSSFPYHDQGSVPTTSEHPVSVPNPFGVEKRFYIHNPLNFGISVKLACSSMFNDDPTVYVRPHTSKFIMVTGRHVPPSCEIETYTVDYANSTILR